MSEREPAKESLYLISDEEMKLIRRLRALQSGAHLVIIHADGDGIYGVTVLESGKVERLRRGTGVMVARRASNAEDRFES